MFVIITVAFFLIHAAPGGPFDKARQVPPEIEKRIEQSYRLDKPVGQQWVYYIGALARGDLGPSMKFKDKSVADIIAEGLPTSLLLGSSAMAIAIVLGVALGAWSAVKQNKPQDYLAMGVALIGVCVPGLVMAPLLQLIFGVQFHLLPTTGLARDHYAIQYLILPVVTLALPQIAVISRLMRASMIEALRSNAIRTARAKGLPETQVVLRHAMPVAILPVIAYLGPAIAGVLTGGLIVESVFALPGIGRQFTMAATNRDYPLVMGVVIMYAALIIALNLAADMLARALDPRARTP
jgi:oligopeptide transport system permease protein